MKSAALASTLALVLAVASTSALSGCKKGDAAGASSDAAAEAAANPDWTTAAADAEHSASGLAWKITQPGTGTAHPAPTDKVKVNYSGWTKDGKMFDGTSRHGGQPATFGVGQVIPGWTEALQLMVVGEKRRVWIPAALAYGAKPGRMGAPSGDLTFDVELLDIITPPPPPPVPDDVAAPPATAKKTKSGLAYRVLTPGTDPKAKKPDATSAVKVNYAGWTTDGKMFDRSEQPVSFPLSKVIKGWTEGMQLMKVGDKFRFWIPGELAYDDPSRPPRRGSPHGMLVFDVELIDVMPGPPMPGDGGRADVHAASADAAAHDAARDADLLAVKSRGVRLPDARDQIPRVEVRGQDARWHEDLYHRLLVTSWWQFFAVIAVAFLVLNVVFALAFLAEPGSIAGARPRCFEDAFFFSVQTLATIGYGSMSPATRFAHSIVTVEALAGMLSVALITGLTFAKFARPTARILFSEKVVLSKLNGAPTVMFRMANWRGNLLVEAQLRVIVLMDERSPEGETFRRPVEIPLVRDRNATFFLTWTAMHRVDDRSPFAGDDPIGSLRARQAQILLSLSGIDETAGSQVHARHTYALDDVVLDARFADVISTKPDGSRIIDYTRFHEVEPAKEKLC